MTELFATGNATLILVIIIDVLSLLFMALIITIFRTQSEKYRLLLTRLGDTEVRGVPGRFLIPVYCLSILIGTIISLYIIIAQPHLL